MENTFRQAKELWDKKSNGVVLTEEEEKLVGAALIPLMLLPECNNTPIDQLLEKLAKVGGG